MKNVFKFEEIEPKEGGLRASWAVPFDLPYLEGHFPSQPIVPAVAIIDASIELLRTFDPAISLKGIKSSKFLNPLVPGIVVEIECRKIDAGEWSVDWKVLAEEAHPEAHAPSVHLIARLALVV